MRQPARLVASFPAISIPSSVDGLPVEVSLIAQLGPGAGDQLYVGVAARQRAHPDFVDALDEPSTRLGTSDFSRNDATALYTFTVGPGGHPFHRHAGHRVFTAISGSSGAQLRFSSAPREQLVADPSLFFRTLHFVDIPPDCLFTVRFGGGTWHQFVPLKENAGHPALFALSCHTNELGGVLPAEVYDQIQRGDASIPALTELLPQEVIALMDAMPLHRRHVPTTRLALDAAPESLLSRFCSRVRAMLGGFRYQAVRLRHSNGFLSATGGTLSVTAEASPAADSLLLTQLDDGFHHQDSFCIQLGKTTAPHPSATQWLSRVLDGFVENPPTSVSRMMAVRNALVRPWGLRTSRLGCPASSLLSRPDGHVFNRKHPVLAQAVDKHDRHAQVILGADDKHLRFRSCVGLRILADNQVEITLGTRVQCKNRFGHFYMAMIESVHRRHVSPTMLRMATEHAFPIADRLH